MTAIVNGVPMVAYYPTYLFRRTRFVTWTASDLFPAADHLGPAGLTDLVSFRTNLAMFHLPDVWAFAEQVTPEERTPDNYQVLLNANSVGISAYPDHWRAAFEGFPNARRVSVRNMQAAHTCLWRWLLAIARAHLAHPNMTAEEVIEAALPDAPTHQTRYDGPFIFQPFNFNT